MIQKKWFRVETGKDGSVLSCEEVEAKGKAVGSVVRFYEAADKADACRQAKLWWSHKKEIDRDYSEKRQKIRRKAGLCSRCGKNPRAKNRVNCEPCQKLRIARAKELAEGAERIRPTYETPEAALAAKIASRDKVRTEHPENLVLIGGMIVLKKLDELSPGEAPAFRSWLMTRIGIS